MKTKLLFISLAIIIASMGVTQDAKAQKMKTLGGTPIQIKTNNGSCSYCCTCDPPNLDSIESQPLFCNTPSLADSPACDSADADGTIRVNFKFGNDEFNIGNHVFITNNMLFTNNTSCNENFVVCAMVSYKAPIKDQNHKDTVGTALIPDPYFEPENQWLLTEDTCPICSTHCKYTCQDIGLDPEEYWSYYFGCQDVNLAPGQSKEIFSGSFEVSTPLLTYLTLDDSSTKPITLSQNSDFPLDSSITTWNFRGMYMDFLKGCQFLSMSGCNFGGEANQELSDTVDNYKCTGSDWFNNIRLIASHGSVPVTGIASFPVGNQATTTMSDTNNAHTVYPVEFIGYLAGAPAGSELVVYAPEDTAGGMAIIDSGVVWTDTVGACQSDTLRFEFPFVIPPMKYLDRDMNFVLRFPADSCSNVGNGKRIYLNGEVMANTTTPLYDSGAFMYNAKGIMILDTTPPHVTTFSFTPIDSTRLAIRLTGVDDTTMVDKGYVIYSLNGGPEQVMVLRYADSLAVGDTTTFVDTLVSSLIRPFVSIKGFVGNEMGLLDSTAPFSYPLKAAPQQGVNAQQEDSLRVNYLLVDHQAKILTLDVQADGAPIELDLVTEGGRSTKLASEQSSPNGEQKFMQSIANFASGAYFLVIHSGSNSIIENIVL